MRHRRKFNHLSRKSAHRKAMLANMATSLILHKRINTTLAKAKALRSYIEPLITKSKEDTTHSRRVVFSYLQSKEAVTELFRDISVKVADRPGGYTRIIKTGARLGDNAEMAMMELVDFNENLLTEKDSSAKAAKRRRRGGKKKTDEAVAETTSTEVTAEETTDEAAVAEVAEEVKEETTEEKVEAVEEKVEEVVEEPKVEEPVAEAKVEEVKEEAPAVVEEEVKEEPKAEEKKEEAKEKSAEEEDKKKEEEK